MLRHIQFLKVSTYLIIENFIFIEILTFGVVRLYIIVVPKYTVKNFILVFENYL